MKKESKSTSNLLIHETSPYLRMHAHNPVHWFPWNEQALGKARAENKPILLSIGYTACHWCHVMAKESFEDQSTADLMNQNFINIKVDREERPDLDKIYQIAYQIFSQRVGGWPLTVFLTPDKHIPFFVGTYFPDEPRGNLPAFKVVLEYVAYFFQHHQSEINQQNNSLTNVFKAIDLQNKTTAQILEPKAIEVLREKLINDFDNEHGGFGYAPKFPLVSYLEFLITDNNYNTEKSSTIKHIIHKSLMAMAEGGLYDHLGGGFFRYCVDANWTIPHFEKMLYDNAELLSLYTEAFLLTKDPKYKNIAIQTASWIINTMQSQEHGYFSTLSADSEGREGTYYVWTDEKIKSSLSEKEFKIIENFYGLDLSPNFESLRHLTIKKSFAEIAAHLQSSEQEVQDIVQEVNKKLLQIRNKRTLPEIDHKILVSWNGLTIQAMLMAGYYLDNTSFIESAERALAFIKNNLWQNEELYSVYTDHKKNILGYLDDYVFLIYALLYALQVNWNSDYLSLAISLIKKVLSDFMDKDHGGFYFTAKNAEQLLFRIKQHQDDAVPSSNALATFCLLMYGFLLGETSYIDHAEKSLKNAFEQMQKIPEPHCSFFTALNLFFNRPEIIIVRGPQKSLLEWREVSKKYYRPFRMIFMIPDTETNLPESLQQKFSASDKVMAYYCHGYECRAPITSLQEFEDVLRH